MKINKKVFILLMLSFLVKESYCQKKGNCKFEVDEGTNIFSNGWHEKLLKPHGFVTNGKDSLFFIESDYISVHGVKCDRNKIGLMVHHALLHVNIDTVTAEYSFSKPAFNFVRLDSGIYSLIEPVEIIYLPTHRKKYDFYDTVKEEPKMATFEFKQFTEMVLYFPDKSYLKFINNGKNKYLFLSSNTGIARNYANYFY